MAYQVFIAGGYFHESDLGYLPGASDLKIDGQYPGLTVIQDVDQYFAAANRADLAIFLTHGGKMEKFFSEHGNRKSVKQFFANSQTRKVMWSVDAHHLWQKEIKYQQYFDRLYVADTSVMKHYDRNKVAWMPCYYRFLSIDDLIVTTGKRRAIGRTVIFPHHFYKLGDRNEVASRIQEVCQAKKLSSFFGAIGSETDYLEAILTTKVCLNVSLLSEVNLRSFEALACNRILLADWGQDYSQIQADWSSTVFYHRNLHSFSERLDQALSIPLEAVTSMRSIVNQHMLTHRYIEIINRESGTNYQMDAVYPEVRATLPAAVPGCVPRSVYGNFLDRVRAVIS